jgi:hypothetical protein
VHRDSLEKMSHHPLNTSSASCSIRPFDFESFPANHIYTRYARLFRAILVDKIRRQV